MGRVIGKVVVMAWIVFGLGFPGVTAAGGSPCWEPPIGATVADPFREPACRWCAGNRGLEYVVPPGSAARAATTGTVTFSGVVSGVRYVVVELPNGWRQTYGRLASTSLSAGDAVIRGSVVGRTTMAFFFGVRIGERYIDPAMFLGRLVGRPRLIPTDGSPGRQGAPPMLRCHDGRRPR